jgi:transposase
VTPPISEPLPINQQTSPSPDAGQPPAKETRVCEAITTHHRQVLIEFFRRAGPPAELCGLGRENAAKLRLAVMDMWLPFRKLTQAHAPNASVLFDKFHILRHLGEALDKVRKTEYARLTGKERRFIKGQKYVLLSHKANLTSEGERSLKLLLAANKRLNTAYILRESFDQLWTYKSEVWARKFFDNWKSRLRWQRLAPYEKFAKLVEGHWDGITAYCKPESKVALGFVEGFNNKIRVIQRRAYGLRDEEYLKLKILTTGLPRL